jgi:alpha-glucuronidase
LTNRTKTRGFTALFLALLCSGAGAESGYDLWLRYAPADEQTVSAYRDNISSIVASDRSPQVEVAVAELSRGLGRILGQKLAINDAVDRDGALLLGTEEGSAYIRTLSLPLDGLGNEGFVIRSVEIGGHRATVIAANSDRGILYGAFELLRLVQTQAPIDKLDIASAPKLDIRVLNHWDNLNGFVERGYAGESLWDWQNLPEYVDARYRDYARANASLGINGAVLNNVNANASILLPMYLEKVAAIADTLRPYGMRVYLSARFSAPAEIGGLDSADPLDKSVQTWWKEKAQEIYALIPDFGGFLVKANSEGQPGPQDYGRTHADGANMLADAIAPHGGIVMWRAFVYSDSVPVDRVRQAYDEFVPLDGRFRPNVLVQVKNGPLDFQPREPFHPLFGAVPDTALMMEFQITKEYLGFASHLAYLGPLYEEVLKSDTYAKGPGSTVARVIDGTVDSHELTGIAGVANIGSDINWTGSIFNQANWYVFGRMAWDPELSAQNIAEEWARQTFTNDSSFVNPVVKMMMVSREAVVDYMTPLGLAHLMATGHHYGPGPWVDDLGREDWNPVYYHRSDKHGIGFDRTSSGSGAVEQYHKPLTAKFEDPATTPLQLLLWFHHLPWDYKTETGATIWESLLNHYSRGIDVVDEMRATWNELKPFVDADRFTATDSLLAIQQKEARWWRDVSIAYFQSVSGLPLPEGVTPPRHPLEYYEKLRFPHLDGY